VNSPSTVDSRRVAGCHHHVKATEDQTNAFIDRVTGLMEQYWSASTKQTGGQWQQDF
jgi:hypothetical protein